MRDLTIRIPHFLLTSSHVCKVVDDRLGKVFQLLQLHFHRLQFLRFSYLHPHTNKHPLTNSDFVQWTHFTRQSCVRLGTPQLSLGKPLRTPGVVFLQAKRMITMLFSNDTGTCTVLSLSLHFRHSPGEPGLAGV